jgi:Protein of unknown function (DUF1488)
MSMHTLTFPDPDPRFRTKDMIFWGLADQREATCFCFTVEARLEARWLHSDNDDLVTAVEAYGRHRQQIEAIACEKFASGECEEDGTVLITSEDVRRLLAA